MKVAIGGDLGRNAGLEGPYLTPVPPGADQSYALLAVENQVDFAAVRAEMVDAIRSNRRAESLRYSDGT